MKYTITENSITHNFKKLYQIKCLESIPDHNIKIGDLGGYIESENNLSQFGSCWVGEHALVFEDGQVFGDALVCGNAHVREYAHVFDNSKIFEDARIYGNAEVYENVQVSGGAFVCGNAILCGEAKIFGSAKIYDRATIFGNAKVYGDARVFNNVEICSNAKIISKNDYIILTGFGSYGRATSAFTCSDNIVRVKCGCFVGDLDEFRAKILFTHSNNKFAKEYLAMIELIKIRFNLN